jgi:peptidoglycan hydrolase CwlO-like protein
MSEEAISQCVPQRGVHKDFFVTATQQSQTRTGKFMELFTRKENHVNNSGQMRATTMNEQEEILELVGRLKESEQSGWSAFNKAEEIIEKLNKKIEKLEKDIEELKWG